MKEDIPQRNTKNLLITIRDSYTKLLIFKTLPTIFSVIYRKTTIQKYLIYRILL